MKTNRLHVLGITYVALLNASVVWAGDKPKPLDLDQLRQQMQTMNEMPAGSYRESEPGEGTTPHPGMVQDRQRLEERLNSLADDKSAGGHSRGMRFGVGYESRMGGGQFPGFGGSGGFPATGGTAQSSGGPASAPGSGSRR